MKTNLMKSILHLKEDTEYQIPLREGDIEKDDKEIGRAKAGVASATQARVKRTKDNADEIEGRSQKRDAEAQQNLETSKEEVKQVKATATQSQGELPDAQKSKNDQSKADSEAAKEAKKKTDEISQEEVNNDDSSALENLEEDPEEKEQQTTEENNNKDTTTTTESVPQVDSAKAALDEMKKLASQEGVVHPSLFISNFSKILGLMERAMQLQVKESGSATEEKTPETTKQTETPAKDK